ncbi:hypothetical protein LINGRAHAP2_LOCUS20272 [Linum grandiflorum]
MHLSMIDNVLCGETFIEHLVGRFQVYHRWSFLIRPSKEASSSLWWWW